jgi:myosin I
VYPRTSASCDALQPPGIFSILNDVCATMHAVSDGADAKFIDKVHAPPSHLAAVADAREQVKGAIGGHAHFTSSTGQFCVKHYAGDVNYTAKNFCDRNKDTMSMDVVAHLQGTKHKLVKMFFPPPEAGDEKRRPTTTAFKIKSQAQKLVKTLLECSPHYVR